MPKKKKNKEPVVKFVVNTRYVPVFPIPKGIGIFNLGTEKRKTSNVPAKGKVGNTELSSILPAAPKTRIRMEDTRDPLADKSLALCLDPRYKEMTRFQQNSAKAGSHFAKLMGNKTKSDNEESDDGDDGDDDHATTGFADIAALEQQAARAGEAPDVSAMKGRMNWQLDFDRTMKRLFVDFELSDTAACRIGHLDRMHNFFLKSGQKQVRKTKEGPSYLVVDNRRERPPGSTACVPPLDEDSKAAVEGLFTTNKSRCRGRIHRPGGLPAVEA